MTPQEYCNQKVAQSGSSFYYSFLYLPTEKKQAITALYAFCREVDDIVDKYSEKHIAELKLAWWQQEIERLFSESPQHPITQALLPYIIKYHLPKSHFYEILEGMQMDLNYHGYEKFSDLEVYTAKVAGAVGILSAHILGFKDAQTLEYAKKIALFLQLVNILRDCGEDALRGRIYFPVEELKKYQVLEKDILERRTTKEFIQYSDFWKKRALQYYLDALTLLPSCDHKNQRISLVMANIYKALLTTLEKDQYAVLKQRYSLTPLKKFWITWRTMMLS
jgi:phytoene synthase